MTFDAIANRWVMNFSLDLVSVFVRVARNAERNGGAGKEFYPGNILINSHLMTAVATCADGRVD